MLDGVLIYSLHPLLINDVKNWSELFSKVQSMGFTYIHMNYSEKIITQNSMYSINNYYSDNTSSPDKNPENFASDISEVIKLANDYNLKPIINLEVKNFDVTLDYCKFLLSLGFHGFWCTNPQKTSEDFWLKLINSIKSTNPSCDFFGITINCDINQTIMVAEVGFDYIFNNSKWWNLQDEEMLKDYKKILGCAPTIAFPELFDLSDDYADLSSDQSEYANNENLARTHYAFAALFSTGVLMPQGYESAMNTNNFDISEFVKSINIIKTENLVFREDNMVNIVYNDNSNIFIFSKYSLDKSIKTMIILNKNNFQYERCKFSDIYSVMDNKLIFDISPTNIMKFIPKAYEYYLAPGEVRILIAR